MSAPVPTDLVTFLSSTELFKTVSSSAIQAIAAKLDLISLRCGDILIRQGAAADDLYIVMSGALAVTTSGSDGTIRFLTTLGPRESAGGWLTGGSDSVEVAALQDSSAARFSRTNFDAFAEKHPEDAAHIMDLIIQRLHRSRLRYALYLTEVFGNLDALALRELENELDLVSFPGGQVIMRQGDPGDCVYVVVSGRVQVVHHGDGHERVIAELGIGEVIGEIALLTDGPRTATAYAIRDTHAARLSRASFERFLLNHPHAAFQLLTRKAVTRVGERLSGSTVAGEGFRTLAVMPAACNAPLTEFAFGFAQALSSLGPTLHLNASRVDAALGEAGSAQAKEMSTQNLRLIEWLSHRESEHRYVVYECDASPTAWSRRCIRQADYILLIGRAGSDPSRGESEDVLMKNTDRRRIGHSLVLWHTDHSNSPQDTSRWLAVRNLHQHFHLRANSTQDIRRITRFLVGRAFGLTLGGGFARGLVHIGVLRALREAGLSIDAIGGNSMGAVIAAQWAQGWDLDTMLQRTAEGCRACLKDMTLPLVAFHSGEMFSNLIQTFNGEKRIEDLWVPYFCVSANLNRAELKVHKEGALAKAILASTRVPGVFPPIIYDGEMHIDGGILNNVPVDVMRDLTNNGIVMGVDAVPNREFGSVPDFGFHMKGWQILGKRLNPFGDGSSTGLPSIVQIMLRTMEFGGVYRKRSLSAEADLYLRPPLQKFKATDFSMASEIAETGYRSAVEALEGWLNNKEIRAERKPLSNRILS